jgi:fructan beta-fructosidase
MMSKSDRPTRRQFLVQGCAAVAAPYVITSAALGADGRPPASERIVMGGFGMWSGGAAVDRKNTGGWKTGQNDVIIATWTYMGRGECIAYSNDKGRTFTEYEGNPIIKHNGRDPKPFWYAYDKDDTPLNDAAAKLGGHWVIAVSDQPANVSMNTAFYTSTDLKEWTEQSHLKGYRECAEVFTLPVDGNRDNTRWIVFGGDAAHAIGDFDGKTFTPEHKGKHVLHYGRGFYASQCFSDAPDGRRVQVGWATGLDFKGMPFSQTFSFPTELTLRTTPDGVRMFGEPVKEIEKIHGKTQKAENQPLGDEWSVEFKTEGALFDIRAVWEVGAGKQVGLDIDGREEFLYDVAEAKIKDVAAAKTKDVAAAKTKLLSLEVHELNATWP